MAFEQIKLEIHLLLKTSTISDAHKERVLKKLDRLSPAELEKILSVLKTEAAGLKKVDDEEKRLDFRFEMQVENFAKAIAKPKK